MVSNKFDLKSLEETSRNIPTDVSYLESLALLDLTAADVLENVNRHLPNFSQFGDRFMKREPKFPNGKIDIPWLDYSGLIQFILLNCIYTFQER